MSDLLPQLISLGAGVQSSTMALMAACGELTPMPQAAIFADTQAEPISVYRWLDWLERQLPFPVFRATYGNLARDSAELRLSKKSGKVYSRNLVPVFMKNPNGTKGILPRKCTRDYKIAVIGREAKKFLGVKRMKKDEPPKVVQWIGISFDELERVKASPWSWAINRHPLVDAGVTRQDCLDWMQDHGFPKPPRSACVFCPYHSDVEWLRLKNEEPAEFQKAVEWERTLTNSVAQDEVTEGIPFLHDSLVPLELVVFNPNRGKAVHRECEGMCGV